MAGAPRFNDLQSLQTWCRDLAAKRGAGLIEATAADGDAGAGMSLIYKRSEMPAYVFTGMTAITRDDVSTVWTVVCAEREHAGMREATVTARLMKSGAMSLDDYQRTWARDPYDPEFAGVPREVMRFVSDDARFDAEFPNHPLSRLRRILAALPQAVDAGAPSA